jgi:ABC-2 type transport system ATP-binding protein
MTDAGPIVAARQLTKSYGVHRGIVELTFAVDPGEVFGFLGPNGAGKTTTIRTMLDLIRPTSGSVALLGLDSHARSVEIHRQIGYLPGEFALYEHMTGRDYLAFFADLRGGADPAFVDELAKRLDSDLDERIASLSHGNKQKLGLIQAFMHRPRLLILDEPTQGLDPLIQQEFHRMVWEARDAGQTVFLSSHVMPEVERVCDRVGIIREGSLVAVEDVGALKAKAVRTLEVHFAEPVPRQAFVDLPGVSDLEVHGDVVRCDVTGSMDAVIKAAARFELLDVESHEPSLEDIFLRFYGREGGDGR